MKQPVHRCSAVLSMFLLVEPMLSSDVLIQNHLQQANISDPGSIASTLASPKAEDSPLAPARLTLSPLSDALNAHRAIEQSA